MKEIMKDVKELKNELKNYLENRNCKEHNRLIVATLNVDSDNKKMYCIDCIKEIEQQFNDNKTELVMVKSATKSMRVQLDKLERWITTHTKYDINSSDNNFNGAVETIIQLLEEILEKEE